MSCQAFRKMAKGDWIPRGHVLEKQPKKMIVVGSGAIGMEFAYFYHSMGTEVTVVEYMPNIVPVEDEDVSKQLERSFKNPE